MRSQADLFKSPSAFCPGGKVRFTGGSRLHVIAETWTDQSGFVLVKSRCVVTRDEYQADVADGSRLPPCLRCGSDL